MKRIVKRTLGDGTVRYCVEELVSTNRSLTIYNNVFTDGRRFLTYEAAKDAFDKYMSDKVVSEEIVAVFNFSK